MKTTIYVYSDKTKYSYIIKNKNKRKEIIKKVDKNTRMNNALLGAIERMKEINNENKVLMISVKKSFGRVPNNIEKLKNQDYVKKI